MERPLRSFVLHVVLERDEDVWRAFIPDLEAKGAATWGHTREGALQNIQEVAQMVMEELQADGGPLPASVTISEGPRIAVNV